MENKNFIKRGKQLSFLLRHDTDYEFDEHVYRTIDDLIKNNNIII